MESSSGPSGPHLRAWLLTDDHGIRPPRDPAGQAGGQCISGNTMFLMQWDSSSPSMGRPVPCAGSDSSSDPHSDGLRPQPCHRS